jgi:hypothetical protein
MDVSKVTACVQVYLQKVFVVWSRTLSKLPLLVLQLVDIDVLAQESRQLQSNRDS